LGNFLALVVFYIIKENSDIKTIPAFIVCPDYHPKTFYLAVIPGVIGQRQPDEYLSERGNIFIHPAIGSHATYIPGSGEEIIAIGGYFNR